MMKLTDTQIRKQFKPSDKPVKHADGQGLTLTINPNGSKLWSLRYRLHGKPRNMSLGRYPEVTLAAARQAALDVRREILAGRDPVAGRQATRREAADAGANTFRAIAEDWIKINRKTLKPSTAKMIEQRLAKHVYPQIGDTPIEEITVRAMAQQSDSWFRRLVVKVPSQAASVRRYMSAIFEHAVRTGVLAEGRDPAHYLRSFVAGRQIIARPAALTIADARGVLSAVEARGKNPTLLLLNRWLVLTSVRSIEARGARWTEITGLDTDSPVWTIPADRMKGRKGKTRAHVVPLTPRAVEILRTVRQHCTLSGERSLIFALRPGVQIAGSSLEFLYKRAELPVKHVPHGWRATFSTIMNERCQDDRAQVDMMLAHMPGGRGGTDALSKVEAAYNRATFLTRRRELAAIWADLILSDVGSAFALVGMPEPVRLVA